MLFVILLETLQEGFYLLHTMRVFQIESRLIAALQITLGMTHSEGFITDGCECSR